MAYDRTDRDVASRDQEDDRKRPTGRWVQDDETGYLHRRLDDPGRDAEADHSRDPNGQDHDDHHSRGDVADSHGVGDSTHDTGRGHAFDFARQGSGRPDSRQGYRSREGQGRFSDPDGSGDRAGREPSGGGPQEALPDKDKWISRYVAADGRRSDEGRSTPPAGSFRGKGPKGYTRSDDRIKEDVSDRLGDDDTLDASDITVDVVGGEVTLSGCVDSRQAKRTAEACAEQCIGITQVQNNLRVGTAASPSLTGPETVQIADDAKTAGF